MSVGNMLLLNAFAIGICVLTLWLISLKVRDASIVDLFWGAGFVVVAWLTALSSEAVGIRQWITVGIVTLWGIRLSTHLMLRNWGKPEDYRYVAMRKKHGSSFPIVSLLTVFALQGFLMWVISLPLQFGIFAASSWHPAMSVGLILFAIGFFFETVGDYQLARFKASSDNRGRVMDQGLWRYTRHPNYFGDFLVWWGFYLVSFEASHWWTVIGPLLMSFFLMRISGVPMLEASLKDRIDGYDAYLRTTSAFFPLPPRRCPLPESSC